MHFPYQPGRHPLSIPAREISILRGTVCLLQGYSFISPSILFSETTGDMLAPSTSQQPQSDHLAGSFKVKHTLSTLYQLVTDSSRLRRCLEPDFHAYANWSFRMSLGRQSKLAHHRRQAMEIQSRITESFAVKPIYLPLFRWHRLTE